MILNAITNQVLNVGTNIASNILWNIYGQPDVLLGIIPIFTAQRYELAKSYDLMKYRAVAGQFFAHQKGGNVAFKVVLYLVGPQTLNYVTYIEALHIYGQGHEEIVKNVSTSKGISKLINTNISKKKFSKIFKKGDDSWKEYESHHTFPIITREEILHDMYIESVVYERDVQFGDALKVSLMCRKYIRPVPIASITLFDSTGAIITTPDAKSMISNGVFADKVKKIAIGHSLSYNSINNVLGLAEQILHRKYMNVADPYTDVETARAVAARNDGSIYGLAGLLEKGSWETISSNLSQFGEDISNLLKIGYEKKTKTNGSTNSKLSNIEFANEKLGTIYITDSSKAELLKTCEKGKGYEIEITSETGNYYTKIFIKDNGTISKADILKNKMGDLNGTISANSFIMSEDSAVILLIAKESDSYNIYKYEGDIYDSNYEVSI